MGRPLRVERLRVGGPDRLSALALVKRFAPAVCPHPSIQDWRSETMDTATIATAGWVRQVQEKTTSLQHKWIAYSEAVGNLNNALPDASGAEGPGHLLLEELSNTADWLKKEYPEASQESEAREKLTNVLEKRTQLIAAARAEGQGSPPRYLAAIAADGDFMGKRLSGDYCAPGEYDARFYHDLSAKLLTVAGTMQQTVSGAGGLPVYAGGDDLLALVHLEKALCCAADVRDAFVNAGLPGSKKPATLSAGVVFFHYKHDLRNALRQTRDAEHDAKAFDRDACALRVLKRSGSEIHAVVSWDHLHDFLKLRDLLAQGASSRWLYRLTDLSRAVGDGTLPEQVKALLSHFIERTETDEALKTELVAVVRGLLDQTNAFMAERHERLRQAAHENDRHRYPLKGEAGFVAAAFQRFIDLLSMAAFLARGGD